MVVFIVDAIECEGQRDVKTLSSLRKDIADSRAPGEAARAFEALFERVGRNGLHDLKWDHDTAIALQAAWRELEEQLSDGANSLPALSLQRFLGLLEGRIRCKIPSWWEKALISGDVHRTPRLIYYAPSGTFKYQKMALDLFAPEGTSLGKDGGSCTIKVASKRVSLPIEIVEKAVAQGRDNLSISIGEDRAYVALHDSCGFRYLLVCLDVNGKAGEVRWTSEVWGSGRRVLGGRGHHDVSLVEQDGHVIVFGQESHGMYIECFEVETGKNLFRFRTSMPFPE
jgi:hypothetical protein